MKRLLLALATVVLLLLVSVSTATASPPAGQSSGQAAGSDQGAGATAGTAQQGPTNSNSPVRVLSPGDAGSVAQSNEASSNATAGNQNGTAQSAGQTQGGSGVQVAGQSVLSAQDALGLAATLQNGASNENAPVRDESEGGDGSTSQSNAASSDATAGNANATEQAAGQTQAGTCCDAAGSQTVGQSADNEQSATALSATVQENPSNSNVPVRVLSPGDDGSVTQSNEATSNATAANVNETTQTADQNQVGAPRGCGCGDSNSMGVWQVCGCPASGPQLTGQSADNAQEANAVSLTEQSGATNENISVRVLSPGNNGSVSQSNVASSNAAAGNSNATEQSADQSQAGSGAGSQIIGQSASNEQSATALSATKQENPSNSNISVRVLSPGDDGDVSQSNVASSNATAANVNGTSQTADQTQGGGSDSCKCGSAGSQVIGQSADSHQGALAASLTEQKGAKNENISVRVLSPGNNGSVSQSNVASSNAAAGNANRTEQSADQAQSGDSCKCGNAGTQVIGQSAQNAQGAAALSATIQEKPSNSNVPVRVLSYGDDGDVSQSNVASSNAIAANVNGTKQSADQVAGDPRACGCGNSSSDHAKACGCADAGSQIIGQSASNHQGALAGSLTVQKGASNENNSVRDLSPGSNGSVSQSNVASSNAAAGNANWTGQWADQTQAGGSCKCGSGTQVIGQSAQNAQGAVALSATIQEKPSNSNVPVRVLSYGDDGDVSQSNVASSNATAANVNGTKQGADQSQAGGAGIQVIGQESKSGQFALAGALTVQLGASNENAPVRVLSPGYGGSVSQTNSASSNAAAGNSNWTGQKADQEQAGNRGGCCGAGIQAIGQSSHNWQGAKSLAITLQLGPKPPCRCQSDSQIGNSNAPVRVLSPGDDGDVRQSNAATSNATSANWNATKQDANQVQDRACGCKSGYGIQAIGQLSGGHQFAASLAATLQLDAGNKWAPDRKSSPGHYGDLSQLGQDAARDAAGSRTATDQSKNQVTR